MKKEETCIDCFVKAYQLIAEFLKEISNNWYFFIILLVMLFVVDFFYRKKLKIKKINYDYFINLILVYSAILFILFLLPLSIFDKPKENFIKTLSSFGPWITALAVIKFSLLQYNLLKEQKEIAKYQGFVQRTSFIYNEFIKEKQNKIVELRKKYIPFQESCIYFLSILFPCTVAEKNQKPGEIPNVSLENSKNLIGMHYHNAINKDKNLSYFYKTCDELYQFLISNEVFLANSKDLYDDLRVTSKAFKELFENILADKQLNGNFESLKQFFDILCNKVDFSYSLLPEIKHSLITGRIFFYQFMQFKLMREKNGINNNLLYLIPDSLFQNKNFAYTTYTTENIKIWSQDDFIASITYGILQNWFQAWQKTIDNYFKESFNDVKAILNNDGYFFTETNNQEKAND